MKHHNRAALARQRGFTLVELMVTVAIALFLLYGLVTTVQNVRQTSLTQQKLAQLQDEQRFAMTVLTDVIQDGGYVENPLVETLASNFLEFTESGLPFQTGYPFYGSHVNATTPDVIGVRFITADHDGVLNCLGGTNTTGAPLMTYNVFTVANGQLTCALNGGAPQPLINNVQNLQIMYGVKRLGTIDYNVDTYVTPDVMTPNDWTSVSAVRISLTLGNPLYVPGGTLPQYVTFDRVVEVMARAGDFQS
jgi:type IV pilus assembly protein PilW